MERDMQLLGVYISNSGSSMWLPYLNNTYCSWLKNKGYLDELLFSEGVSVKRFNTYLADGAVHKITRKQVCS